MKKTYIDVKSGRPITLDEIQDDDEIKLVLCIGSKDKDGSPECFDIVETEEDYSQFGESEGNEEGEVNE